MKTVKKIEKFIREGDTCITILYEENGKSGYLTLDATLDGHFFDCAILTQPEHQIDFQMDKDSNMLFYTDKTLGIKAEEYSDNPGSEEDDISDHRNSKPNWLVPILVIIIVLGVTFYFVTKSA